MPAAKQGICTILWEQPLITAASGGLEHPDGFNFEDTVYLTLSATTELLNCCVDVT